MSAPKMLEHGMKVQFCQWPGCRMLATTFIRRGERMANMACCPGHTKEFRGLSDVAAFRVSEARQAKSYGDGTGLRPGDRT